MDKKEIIALIKKVGQEQKGCINSDGEYVDFCKGDEEYVFDNEDVNELAEKLIKLFAIPDVSQHRELLVALIKWFRTDGLYYSKTEEEVVDEFLATNWC